MAETNLMSAASALTTKQLQQKLSSEKKSEHPVLLLFEIPSTRVVENQLSKYVVYEVVVMLSGSFDSRRVSVERRYSDFLRLQRLLLQEFDSALEDVSPPPKLLSGNFCAAVLLQRRLALQDYLAKLFSTRCVRRSPLFAAFFTDAEQRGALVLLRGGQFSPALRQLEDVLALQNPQVCFLSPEPELSGLLVCFPSQEKLQCWQSPALRLPTLCALAVCHCDLQQHQEALDAAQRALPVARRCGLRSHRAALLRLLMDLSYRLGLPGARLQDELQGLQDRPPSLKDDPPTLKELVIQQFT
ncbi:sorting nexin-20 isoform X1 [Notothenia coriiceps]|uniref:Sorting nexin-20 isoform X1 n=1 Tax=Notothenia coriiceps TaxID=8208 RepID=A0A6I9PQM8_9TELE|nr:PREDICTED: sorting nexin-20-like isoform X1 [Notothenia coriiceps]